MDPFNLFWKTVAGLEKVMHYPVKTEWDANFQRGYLILGGVTYSIFSSPDTDDAVRVFLDEDDFVDIEKSLEKFMIADAMEFILGGIA